MFEIFAFTSASFGLTCGVGGGVFLRKRGVVGTEHTKDEVNKKHEINTKSCIIE